MPLAITISVLLVLSVVLVLFLRKKPDPYSLQSLRDFEQEQTFREAEEAAIEDDALPICPTCGEEIPAKFPLCPRCTPRN